MVRFSLAALLAVGALTQQSSAFQAGPASRASSRRPAVAVESDVSVKIPSLQRMPEPNEEQRTGAMMDLSGIVLSVRSCSCHLFNFVRLSMVSHVDILFR